MSDELDLMQRIDEVKTVKEHFEVIRESLNELEDKIAINEGSFPASSISGLELPDLICDIVDFLEPELKPYEFAFYFWLFRHSVVSNGTQRVLVPGRRKLQNSIIKSASVSDGNSQLSYGTVQKAFEKLEEIGAIERVGDTTRDGTPYLVKLPEEISVCQERKKYAQEMDVKSVEEEMVDFYNVRENRLRVFERDGYKCFYCDKQLTRFSATLDHVHPVSEGGDNSLENLVTACLQCNARKNSQEVSAFLAKKSAM